jgi:heavy metal efflux system protein
MIDKIIEFSTRNKLVIGIMMAIWTGWGIISLTKLPIDAMPDITNKQVQVITISRNLGPIEIEKFVTTPLEIGLSNIPGLVEIRSLSSYGLSNVTLVFNDQTELFWARSQVFERLAQTDIPEEFGKPYMAPVSTGLGEIFQYVIRTKDPKDTSFSLLELRTLQDWVVRKNLLGTEGIADVSTIGGYKKEYQVNLNIEQMKSLGISIDELFEAIRKGNGNTGGAYIEKDRRTYIIRGLGLVGSIEDIKNIVIKNNGNVPVLVKDVSDVSLGGSLRWGCATMNGHTEVVGGVVLMQKGENASRVIIKLKEKLKKIQKLLPDNLEIVPFVDRQELVSSTIHTVTKNLIEGALIVILILFLFLGDLRASLITASVIPLSMLFAFGMMIQFQVVGNLMSLGALDFGLIVDGSVIVVEAVVFYISNALHDRGKLSYIERQDIVIGSMKISKKSVFYGILIILVVYIPLLTLEGVEGKMFRPMVATVSFAIIGALILSITYVPMMCALFINKPHKEGGFSDRLTNLLYKSYRPSLSFAIRKKGIVISAVAAVIALAVFTFMNIGGEFIPKLSEGAFCVEYRLPAGTSLSDATAVSNRLNTALLKKFPDEIRDIVAKIGTSEIPTDPMPFSECEDMIVLKDRKFWTKAKIQSVLADSIAMVIDQFPGIVMSVQQPIENRFNQILSGSKTDLVIKVFGDDLNKLVEIGDEIAHILRGIKGAKDVMVQHILGLPQITIRYDRKNMALYGITVDQVNNLIETAFAGKATGIVYEGDRRFDLTVRLSSTDRNKLENIGNLMMRDAKGNLIPLREIATIEMLNGPNQISRYSKQRCIQVGSNVRGRDVETLVEELDKKIKVKMDLPYGYSIDYGGSFENLMRAKQRLSIVVPIALAIIFGLLFASFRNFKDCLLIFTAVPLSAIGGIFALFIRGIAFSISAGVGFIALFGVAVLNGIMLVSHFKHLEEKGIKDLNRIVLESIREKFRPIIMTSAVAALGFLPMAISTAPGAEVQRPLASVVIGGLIISTVLTLIVLPILYMIFNGKKFRSPKATIPSMIILLVAMFFAPQQLKAQQKLTMQQAIELAVKNHPQSKISDAEIQKQKYLLRSTFNLPNPELLMQSPNGTEMRPSVLVRTDFPTVYLRQYSSQRKSVQVAEAEKTVNIQYLIYQVMSLYNSLQFFVEKEFILQRQDSIYHDILEVNGLRYKVGQIAYIDKINGEAKYRAIHNQFIQTRALLKSYVLQFNFYLGFPGDTTRLPDGKITKNDYILPDTSNIGGNPMLKLAEKQISLSEKNLKLARSRMMPGLIGGYFNQGPTNTDSYYRLQFGVSIPVFFWNYTSRMKAAHKDLEISKSKYDYQNFNVTNYYNRSISDYRRNAEALNYYEQVGLLQSSEIIKTAVESYKAGSLSYYVYLVNIEQAFNIDLGYIEALSNFNQSIIDILYITGQL